MGKLHRMVSRSYPVIAGLIFLALGAVTLVYPEILGYYSIFIDNPAARTAARAMIGGGEIGIAIILLIGGRFGFSPQQRSFIAAVIFMSVGLIRLSASWSEGLDVLLGQPLREATIEIILGTIGFWVTKSCTTKTIDD